MDSPMDSATDSAIDGGGGQSEIGVASSGRMTSCWFDVIETELRLWSHT